MNGGLGSFILLMALAGLLLAGGIEDARSREIANTKNAAIALLAPLWWWSNHLAPWPDIALQVAVAAGVFALFAGAFAAGWMGGGDVKMIGALALWLPPGALMMMLVMMSLAGGLVTMAMVAERGWRQRGGRATVLPVEVPYGVAIAAAGLLAIPRTSF